MGFGMIQRCATVCSGVLLMVFIETVGTFADVAIRENTAGRVSLFYSSVTPVIDTLQVNDRNYSVLSFDHHMFGVKTGEPLLPSRIIHFAAPAGANPSLDLSGPTVRTISNIRIAPSPEPVADSDGFVLSVYREDPERYAMSGFIPPVFARLGERCLYGDIAVWELVLTPVLFDAYRSTVAIADSLIVNISWGAQKLSDSKYTQRLPYYIINRDQFIPSTEKPVGPVIHEAGMSPFASGEWYKMTLYDTGMYRITGAELRNAGLLTGSVATDDIHIYYGGGRPLEIVPYELTLDDFREIAIEVTDGGDGTFDANDSFVFYGQALSRFDIKTGYSLPVFQNYPYAERGANAYWLLVSSESPGRRVLSTGEPVSGTLSSRTTYRELIHIERENYLEWIDTYNIESGTEWFWESISSETEQFSFNAPGVVAGSGGVLRIAFRSGKKAGTDTVIEQHEVGIRVNNGSPDNRSIDTNQVVSAIDIVVQEPLKSENNILTLWRRNGAAEESIRLDWLEIEYEKPLALQAGRLEFFITGEGGPEQYAVSNAPSSTILYDTTDPFNVSQFTAVERSNNVVTFQLTVLRDETRRITAWQTGNYLSVAAIVKKARSNLRNPANGADYLIVSHKNFIDQAGRLAAWRRTDSAVDPLRTMVVDVDDVYDEFSWGVFDPAALRDFFKYAHEQYTPFLRYSCLFGDTIFKYKNLAENQTGLNFVPTYTTVNKNNSPWTGIATDDYFTWFDSFNMPSISIGRLCANTREEARILVDKIIDYERNPENGFWHNRILLIGDDEYVFQGVPRGDNLQFTKDIEQLDSNNIIPNSLDRRKMLLIEYPMQNLRKPQVTEDLIKAFYDGYLIMNYIGHGNNDVLAHEYILRGSRDIERINNGARLPLFLVFSCSVGQFDKPNNISLAEMLHLKKDGGCIAIVASARYTLNFQNVMFNRTYYQHIFNNELNPEHRIGYALMMSKQEHQNDGNSEKYIMFGDPATRLMDPRYGFSLADIDTVYRLQKLDFAGNIMGSASPVAYDGTLLVKAYGPKLHKTYSISGGSVNYTVSGKVFYNGEQSISSDSFMTSFVVPMDLQSDGSAVQQAPTDTKIIFFATGGAAEASHALEGFTIGGVYPGAPEDSTGPGITLSFDGKRFDDGDYIRRQPLFTAELHDVSGINILGTRGHNINLTIDESEVIVLTDRFKNIGGHESGNLSYTLPILSPGEHTIDFTAYDTYNNAAKVSVSAQVIGTESGDITIVNLLNYPNPMANEGTTFTFSLNDDARSANIKVYSQSGRLVDTIRFFGEYGFNKVFWKPPVVLANGVYFYKLSIVSMNGRKASKIEKLVVMR